MSVEKPLPACKALLLCEKCLIDRHTGRISLINILNEMKLSPGSGSIESFFVFLQLFDGIGAYRLAVELHDVEFGLVVAGSVETSIEFPDRLRRVNLVIPMPSFPLAQPGEYDIVVFGNGSEIDRPQLAVRMPDEEADDSEAT